MPETPNLPATPPCWSDPWADGATEIRLSPHLLRARWNTELSDVEGVPPSTIISVTDAFEVCFRVELQGDMWRCVCGTWRFDLCFDACGGTGFTLSQRLQPDLLQVKDWKGCERRCVEKCVTVPAGTVTADELGMYEIGATFQLYCCDKPGPVVGHDSLGTYQFYDPGS